MPPIEGAQLLTDFCDSLNHCPLKHLKRIHCPGSLKCVKTPGVFAQDPILGLFRDMLYVLARRIFAHRCFDLAPFLPLVIQPVHPVRNPAAPGFEKSNAKFWKSLWYAGIHQTKELDESFCWSGDGVCYRHRNYRPELIPDRRFTGGARF